MDMIAAEAKVARRTLYHQFASKENVFRAVLTDLMQAIPAALLTEAEAERDLRVALTFLGRALAAHWRMPETVALNRMLIVESRRFPWMAKHHDQLGHAMLIRFVKALRREAQAGRIECPHPSLAARQFIGALAGVLLWPLVQGSERKPAFEPELVIAEAVEMFLLRYSKPGGSS
jgi:AcrR family transcriptional regulator